MKVHLFLNSISSLNKANRVSRPGTKSSCREILTHILIRESMASKPIWEKEQPWAQKWTSTLTPLLIDLSFLEWASSTSIFFHKGETPGKAPLLNRVEGLYWVVKVFNSSKLTNRWRLQYMPNKCHHLTTKRGRLKAWDCGREDTNKLIATSWRHRIMNWKKSWNNSRYLSTSPCINCSKPRIKRIIPNSWPTCKKKTKKSWMVWWVELFNESIDLISFVWGFGVLGQF